MLLHSYTSPDYRLAIFSLYFITDSLISYKLLSLNEALFRHDRVLETGARIA